MKFWNKLALISLGITSLGALTACNGVGFNAMSNSVNNINNVNNTIPPLVCAAGNTSGPNVQYWPTQCLIPQTGLSGNVAGVEINNAFQLANKVFSIPSNAVSGTSADATLYIEIATYIQPDTIVINAIDALGDVTPILDICNISTWADADPTSGTSRPYSDTILQFNVTLPAGTTQLQFDYTGSNSPTYVGVWNLGEFSNALTGGTANPFPTKKLAQFRPQSMVPMPYNDNMDPITGANDSCPNQ